MLIRQIDLHFYLQIVLIDLQIVLHFDLQIVLILQINLQIVLHFDIDTCNIAGYIIIYD